MTDPDRVFAGTVVDDEGVWVRLGTRLQPVSPRPALFLDRDGVVVEDIGYLCRPRDVRLCSGAASVILAANRAGVPVVIATNQSGIGRGLFGWDDFVAVEAQIERELAALGARIDAVFACPFHSAGNPPYRHPDHPARKPNPGMLRLAARMLALDLPRSWIVGDRASDLQAGRNAGLAGGMLVAAGCGSGGGESPAAAPLRPDGGFQVRSAATVAEALDLPPLTARP